ncbi:hypothetical protein SAVIM40S_03200 [Streptomyces avidinii]|uniref:Secreted protein with PEP-CTERM sorting signal n=1 Tax=Streptomyces avidinii TaxID=1895 RepID=A0ABS4LFY2_STRAV|nr:hypothetical protein [Streptomyces avidinii]
MYELLNLALEGLLTNVPSQILGSAIGAGVAIAWKRWQCRRQEPPQK